MCNIVFDLVTDKGLRSRIREGVLNEVIPDNWEKLPDILEAIARIEN